MIIYCPGIIATIKHRCAVPSQYCVGSHTSTVSTKRNKYTTTGINCCPLFGGGVSTAAQRLAVERSVARMFNPFSNCWFHQQISLTFCSGSNAAFACSASRFPGQY
jgi:hypothetical protein